MAPKFSWIHLSDLHSQNKTKWDSNRVLETLVLDLKKKAEEGFTPDAVFFSGDLIYGSSSLQGSDVEDQFKSTEEFLSAIRNCFGLSKKQFFLVPGNHDINRNLVGQDQTLWLDSTTDIRAIEELIESNSMQFQRYVERLNAYKNFLLEFNYEHCLGDNVVLCYGHIIEVGDKKVGIAGLNSAWSCCRDKEKGKLRMAARWQLEKCLSKIQGCDLTIAMAHHPMNWLSEIEDPSVAREIESKFTIFLHGHEHSDWIANSEGHFRIAGGAAYESSSNNNGFNFGEFDLATGQIRVSLRTYSNLGVGGWTPLHIPGKTDEKGQWVFPPLPPEELLVSSKEHSFQSKAESPITRSHLSNYQKVDSDSPPVIDAWVGRESELHQLQTMHSGVAVVTGIGGQGKSALVAKLLDHWRIQNPDGFWDWRDCREEGDKIHTQLVAIIERITYGEVSGENLTSSETKDLVKFFLKQSESQKCLIILDNVDQYTNVNDSQFIFGVGQLVEQALVVGKSVLIVLTCRPRISYPNTRFLECYLQGLTLEEANQLFQIRCPILRKAGDHSLVNEIWSRTDGHPLWLNLIALQLYRSPDSSKEILNALRTTQADNTNAFSLFKALWKGLNSKQHTIMRCMAEMIYPQSQDAIYGFVKDRIKSRNQFERAFRGLRALSLIVERASSDMVSRFDLHPLVKAFVRNEYPSIRDRIAFIDAVLRFFYSFTRKTSLESHISGRLLIENWAQQAELEVNKGDYDSALETLAIAEDRMIATGYEEEFVRLSKLILDESDWGLKGYVEKDTFHTVIFRLITVLAEFERVADGQQYLNRYKEVVPSGTVAFLQYSKAATHFYWLTSEFAKAVEIADVAVKFKSTSNIDTNVDVSYELALALRDSGEPEKALALFLGNDNVKSLLKGEPKSEHALSSRYGNVGRCLQMMGRTSEALICFCRSAILLDTELTAVGKLNSGYANFWIGDVLLSQGNVSDAMLFLRYSYLIWKKRSPLRSYLPEEKMNEHYASDYEVLFSLSETSIRENVMRWINQSINRPSL